MTLLVARWHARVEATIEFTHKLVTGMDERRKTRIKMLYFRRLERERRLGHRLETFTTRDCGSQTGQNADESLMRIRWRRGRECADCTPPQLKLSKQVESVPADNRESAGVFPGCETEYPTSCQLTLGGIRKAITGRGAENFTERQIDTGMYQFNYIDPRYAHFVTYKKRFEAVNGR